MHRAWEKLKQRPEWRVSMSWRGRGFLIKAPHMASASQACLKACHGKMVQLLPWFFLSLYS